MHKGNLFRYLRQSAAVASAGAIMCGAVAHATSDPQSAPPQNQPEELVETAQGLILPRSVVEAAGLGVPTAERFSFFRPSREVPNELRAAVQAIENERNPATVSRSHLVIVDREALRRVQPARLDRLRLDLFNDTLFEVEITRIDRRAANSESWFGKPVDQAGGFNMVIEDDIVLADLWTVDGQAFQVRVLAEGALDQQEVQWAGAPLQVVRQIDQSKFAQCGCNAELDALQGQWRTQNPEPPAKPKAGGDGTLAPGTTFVDVFVAYTDGMRTQTGGVSAANALIQLSIDESNEAYATSSIVARQRLAGRVEVNYDETTGTWQQHLTRLTSTSDDVMDQVHDLRDDSGADLVVLLIDDTDTSLCGLAWIDVAADMAFSVTRATCATTPGWTFAHEIGHNFGCNHDRFEGDIGGTSSFSFGHRFTGNSGSQFRTIMVRQSQPGTRIKKFSNPNVDFDGVATGVAAGQASEADNRLTHNNRASTVAGFRGELPGEVWVDPTNCIPFLEFGTFEFPYCAVSQGAAAVRWGGTLWIKAGVAPGAVTISRAMTVRPSGGTVSIGQ